MEIVIENPVESPPLSPPIPPPLQSLTMSSSPWNAGVTTPPITFSSSTVACTSMPAATTVMTITIAENPTASPTYPPPVQFSYRETCPASSLSFAGDPYSGHRGQPRGRSYGDPVGASPLLRRTDKSGLLGVVESDASGLRSGLRSPRLLSGANTVAPGILSPRRVECIGQLDPVLEVLGQPTRMNVTPGASSVFPVSSSINVPSVSPATMLEQNRMEESRLDPCDALSVASLGRPMKSASFDSLETRQRNDRVDVETTLQTFDRNLDGIESSNVNAGSYSSAYRSQENCEARTRTLGRLSRLALSRNEHEGTMESIARYSETCCNFPFSVRGATVFPGFEATSSLPSTRATTTAVTTSTTTVAASTMRDIDATRKEADIGNFSETAPEEVRAEAEGCEHGSSKNGESSQMSEEFVDNDGMQTLRVIILSEQL